MKAWMRVMMCATACLAEAAAAVAQTRPSVSVAPVGTQAPARLRFKASVTVTPAETQPSVQATPAQIRPSNPVSGVQALQGFSVVLVLGDMQGSSASGDVPSAASRALADMKDFLPYKSYRLLDTAWMLGSSPKGATSRLRGPDSQDYRVSIDSTPAATPTGAAIGLSSVEVRFHLQEAAGVELDGNADQTRRFDELSARRAVLERSLANMEREAERIANKVSKDHPDHTLARMQLQRIKTEMAELESQTRALSGAAKIIDATFTMQIGETVVVGTSRVQGNTALIALLTAVPRGAK